MKKYVLIAILILIIGNCFGQAPGWAWAKSAGGATNELVNSVCTDASGSVYVTGCFDSPVITFGTFTLTNANNTGNYPDIFIVKYDPSGNVIWAKSEGGNDVEVGFCVTTDASSNVYITGYFMSDTITIGTTILINSNNGGAKDIFIVKYDSIGNVIWAKSTGGNGDDVAYGVCTDTGGDIFITGYFNSDSITFGTTTLTNVGLYDFFIAKYDNLGNAVWAKTAGGTGSELGNCVTTDANGNILISGSFYSSSITFGTTTLTNTGNVNFFIVKYDSSGNAIWAKSARGDFINYGTSVSTDATGNIIFTGSFEFPTITFGTIILTNANQFAEDIFIAKYDTSGNVLWAKSAGGIDDDRAYGVTIDATGNIFITGFFSSPTITFGTTTFANSGISNIFIVKYDASGNMIWAKSAGGTNNDYGRSVAIDGSGNVYIAGTFGSPTISFGTTSLTNVWDADMFIAKLAGIAGIVEQHNEESCTISPNPFTSFTTITFNEEHTSTSSVHTIIITDVLGNIIQQSIINSKQSTIDMSGFAKGFYFVRIEDEKKNVVNRKMFKN